MENVTVNKVELLEKIRANREDHRRIFEEALAGFQAKVTQELDKMVVRASRGIRESVAISIRAPEDHTRDYDRVIAMLEMSVEDEISLTQSNFAQYVMDDWDWQGRFLSNVYGSGTARSKFSDAYAVS